MPPASGGVHAHRPGHVDSSHERTVAQVAAVLAISKNVVYYWLEAGQVAARKGPGGRWLIAFGTEVEDARRRRIATSVHLKPSSNPKPDGQRAKEAV